MRRREFLGIVTRGAMSAALLPSADGLFRFAQDAGNSGSAVRLNQAGYLPERKKIATAPSQATSFVLRSAADDSVAFSANLADPRMDEASGDAVRLADFSKLNRPGSYRLELNTGERSAAFPIGPRVYHDPLRIAMRAYYGQRCGCNVDLGGGYRHPACHQKGAFHASSGKSGAVSNHGGWHDAGDYGRYVVNSGISTGTLLWAWEMHGARLKSLHDIVVGKLAKKMGSTRAPSSPQASLDDGPRRFGLGEAVRLNPHPLRRALLDSQGEAAYRSPRR